MWYFLGCFIIKRFALLDELLHIHKVDKKAFPNFVTRDGNK